MAAEGGDIIRHDYTYRGEEGEVIPDLATHIFVQARVIRREAFDRHRNIVEVICHEDVEKIEQEAFLWCRSLRRVIMRGVKIVEQEAFWDCSALEELECDKLETVGDSAFCHCSLKSINLPSARILKKAAFANCKAMTDVKFGSKLEEIEEAAFNHCISLERITIPLKDGLIVEDNTFMSCGNLSHVDLVEGELHETIAALHLEEWRNDMNEALGSINQILLNAAAGGYSFDEEPDPGGKAQAIRRWIRSVLLKIILYQDEHHRLLSEAATTLEPVLPNNDIVMNNVLPFLELPSHTFEMGGDDEATRRLNFELLRIVVSDEEEE